MNITIIGQGAIGLLYYCHLIHNPKVTLSLYSSPRIKTFPEKISFINTAAQTQLVDLHLATKEQLNTADVILICVKSYQIKQVIEEIAKELNKETIIILSHNGMGIMEQISANKNTILLMLTTHGSKKITDYSIEHTGAGRTDLGLISGELNITKKNQLLTCFNSVMKNIFWQENIAVQQWKKLAINCVINPITALENIDNGLVNKACYQQTRVKILEEVVNVAQLSNTVLHYTDLYNTVTEVAKDTAKNCSSMRSDILNKRKTEIDYINGYIHQLGKQYNTPTPVNTEMWQRVNQLSSD